MASGMPCNVASQYSSVVIFNQLGERRLIQLSEDVRQLVSVFEARREGGSIVLAQSSNQRVAVLPAGSHHSCRDGGCRGRALSSVSSVGSSVQSAYLLPSALRGKGLLKRHFQAALKTACGSLQPLKCENQKFGRRAQLMKNQLLTLCKSNVRKYLPPL